MVKQSKIFEVENLKIKIQGAKAVILADFRGLTVNQVNQLRQKVGQAGGELQVIKNSLFKRALAANKIAVKNEQLRGTIMVLFANQDEVLPLKALTAFAKNTGLLPLKLGFLNHQLLAAAELEHLATLPPLPQLHAKLASLLASPPTRLVYCLNYNLYRLGGVLNQIRTNKGRQ